ncbi:hypothetical protein OAV00_01770 [Candidatus Marinimicrobia bacterium]|nr:hypothetical protein [Candidatus Neomarinimicrobiota bacterium]
MIPISSMFAFGGLNYHWFFLNLIFFIFLTLVNNFLSKIEYDVPTFLIPKIFKPLLYTLFFVSLIFFVQYYGINFDVNLLSFDQDLIYLQRSAYKSISAPSGIFNYISSHLTHVFLPVLFAYSILNRKWASIIFLLVVTMIIFSTSAMKSLPIIMLVLLCIIFVEKKFINNTAHSYLLFYSLGLLLINIFFFIFPTLIIIPSLIIYRAIFVPTLVGRYYYEFFQEHNYTYFLDSNIISTLVNQSYYLDGLPYRIGEAYFSEGLYANTGLVADGYSKLGVIGIFIIAVALISALHFIDMLSKDKNQIMIKSMLVYPLLFLINGSLITSFFTGGLFMSTILIATYPTKFGEINN